MESTGEDVGGEPFNGSYRLLQAGDDMNLHAFQAGKALKQRFWSRAKSGDFLGVVSKKLPLVDGEEGKSDRPVHLRRNSTRITSAAVAP